MLPNRSCETTKLLRRSNGVFSKTRRTLTSPPQFRIGPISAPEEFTTTALFERCSCNNNSDRKHSGTVNPTHNCKNRNSDGGYTLARDWKSFPLFLYKGKISCKRNTLKKQFLTDRVNRTCPVQQYISDHRPRGVSLQQLDSVRYFFEISGRITLSRFLNGTAGYRIDSENSIKSSGRYYRIQLSKVHKTEYVENAVIPDICLERRSIGTNKLTVP